VCGSGPNAQFAYGDVNHPLRVTLETDGKGHQTAFEYDPRGQVTRRIEAVDEPTLTRDTTWEYHPTFPALVTRITQPSVDGINLRETTMDYDPLTGDLLSSTISGVEAGAAFTLTTAFAYSSEGRSLSVDPPGYGLDDVTSFTYDATRGGQVALTRTDPLIGTTTFGYDALNRRTAVTDPNGVTTETAYDPLDRVTQVAQKGEVAAADLTTQHVYSEFGDLLRTVLPRGNVIEYGHDAAGRLVSIERKPDAATLAERTLFTLDPAGNRIQEELQSWNGTAWETASATDFVYSTRCHLDRIIQAPRHARRGHHRLRLRLQRQPGPGLGRQPLERHVDPPSTTYSYDPLDRLVSLTQPWAGGGTAVTSYAFDVQDHLTAVTDAEGNTTTYTYSDRDLLTREVSPVSGTTTHAYNEHGELISTTDARGITVARTVDELDRVTFVDYPGTPLDVTYTYDDPAVPFSLGRLTAITRAGRSSSTPTIDSAGRLKTASSATPSTRTATGPRSTILGGDGYVHLRFRGPARDAGSPGRDRTRPGPRHFFLLPALRAFDQPRPRQRPDRDPYLRRPLRAEDDPGPQPARLDLLDRRRGQRPLHHRCLDATQNRAYAYQDVHYFLTQGNGPWGTRGWSYDKIGNRLTETRDGITDTYSYAPNAASGNTALLTQISLGAGGTKTYTHGPAGHLTEVNAAGNQVRFESDAEGRLSALERPLAGARTEMVYDGRSFLAEAVEPKIFATASSPATSPAGRQ
jgi:YD repeat-containing protein